MKRLFAFAVAVMTAIIFVSCSTPLKSETSRKNGLACAFQSMVDITIDNLNANGTVKRFGDGVWDIEFETPNTLSGVKLMFNGGSVEASYKGLDFSVPQSALPVKSMMLNLIEAVDTNARLETLKGTEDGDKLNVSGTLEGGDYIMCVTKDGRISSFEMENNKLKILFSDIIEIESPTKQETTVTVIEETTAEQPTEEVTSITGETAETAEENAEEAVDLSAEDAEETMETAEEVIYEEIYAEEEY
ncbi:MAG: hypothetical protein K2J08_03405 [Ruminococcus sp.]|nr:hypothetical protein [Ruminococcus sp.]